MQCVIQAFLILIWVVDPAADSEVPPVTVPFLFSGTSRGPSPVTLASQDALPIAVAFTESVNAYFKGADPTKWVSHDVSQLIRPDLNLHAYAFFAIFKLKPQNMISYRMHYVAIVLILMCITFSILHGSAFSRRSVCEGRECFTLVWHHSFKVDNLHVVDYSLGQRKHTGFIG